MTVETPSLLSSGLSRRTFEFSRFVRAAGLGAVLIALISAVATFSILLGITPIAPTQTVVLTVLIINGLLVVFLVLMIGWEIASLVSARRRGRAAARLHIRIVALFSVVAAVPAILVAVVASVTLDRGLDNWFSTRTRAIVDNSASIAQAYFDQQVDMLDHDISALTQEVERARTLLVENPDRFQEFLGAVAQSHSMPGVFLVQRDGSPIAEAVPGSRGNFPPPPPSALAQAEEDQSQAALIAPGTTNMIGGIVRLSEYNDVYLYALRPIDPKVIRFLSMTTESINEYNALQATRFGIQLAFGVLYLGVALVVLLSAIWLGIGFANRLVSPIRRLIDAAKQISQGNLAVHVPSRRSEGDLGALSETFNTMAAQLRSQREELLQANQQIDSRRRFTEAVLSGVTAGVLGIDKEGRIRIANRSALRLLGVDNADGRTVTDILPQLEPVFAAAQRDNRLEHRDQISVNRGGAERTVNVRVTRETADDRAHGYVVTLDDITDLVTAQRSSAWADVARRIAHEIKNPLTPIQLSAERLRRKFGKVIHEDRPIFDQCTDTIIRQVGDIGRMVDEFSSFARMPKPAFEIRNLSDSIREAVFLIEVAHPEITFTLELPEEPLTGRFDGRLMAQALTNIVKNGTEAIAALPPEERTGSRIVITGRIDPDAIVVDVRDNGIGFPSEQRHRLLEPYMTTREKGTGLGLAIVTKIIEEHGGRVELRDASDAEPGARGALVRVILPRTDAIAERAEALAGTQQFA